jgi:hypothetical protein
MAEHVVKDVRLLEIIELVGPADEITGDEAAVGEMVEKASSGISPGTATTCQPVRFIRISDSRSKSGIPGPSRFSSSRPSRNCGTTRPGRSLVWRRYSLSQVACSSGV